MSKKPTLETQVGVQNVAHGGVIVTRYCWRLLKNGKPIACGPWCKRRSDASRALNSAMKLFRLTKVRK